MLFLWVWKLLFTLSTLLFETSELPVVMPFPGCGYCTCPSTITTGQGGMKNNSADNFVDYAATIHILPCSRCVKAALLQGLYFNVNYSASLESPLTNNIIYVCNEHASWSIKTHEICNLFWKNSGKQKFFFYFLFCKVVVVSLSTSHTHTHTQLHMYIQYTCIYNCLCTRVCLCDVERETHLEQHGFELNGSTYTFIFLNNTYW